MQELNSEQGTAGLKTRRYPAKKTSRYLQLLSNASDLVEAGLQTGRYVPKRIVTPGFSSSARAA